MSKAIKKSLIIILFVLCAFFSILATTVTGVSASASQTVFAMQDKASIRLTSNGLRFRVAMSADVYEEVQAEDTTVKFVIAPTQLMEKVTDNKYLEMSQKLIVDVDEAKIYLEDGIYMVHGCVYNVKEANNYLDFTAMAYIVKTSDNTVTRWSTPATDGSRSIATVAERAILDVEHNYAASIVSVYSWIGADETKPITVSTANQYAALVKAVKAGVNFEGKYFNVSEDILVTEMLGEDFKGTFVNGSKNVALYDIDVEAKDMYDGKTITLPVASVVDVNGNVADVDVEVVVTDGEGNNVEIADGAINVTKAGTYTATYTAENAFSETVAINVREFAEINEVENFGDASAIGSSFIVNDTNTVSTLTYMERATVGGSTKDGVLKIEMENVEQDSIVYSFTIKPRNAEFAYNYTKLTINAFVVYDVDNRQMTSSMQVGTCAEEWVNYGAGTQSNLWKEYKFDVSKAFNDDGSITLKLGTYKSNTNVYDAVIYIDGIYMTDAVRKDTVEANEVENFGDALSMSSLVALTEGVTLTYHESIKLGGVEKQGVVEVTVSGKDYYEIDLIPRQLMEAYSAYTGKFVINAYVPYAGGSYPFSTISFVGKSDWKAKWQECQLWWNWNNGFNAWTDYSWSIDKFKTYWDDTNPYSSKICIDMNTSASNYTGTYTFYIDAIYVTNA